jgi:Na+-driven multidrug efflux pump
LDTNLKKTYKLKNLLIALIVLIPAFVLTALYPQMEEAMLAKKNQWITEWEKEKEAYEAGGLALRIDGYSQLFMMLEIVIQGVFYGMGRTIPPAIISISCNYLRIPMAMLFVSFGWGLPGIWWTICITSIIKGIIILIWFLTIKKKTLDKLAKQEIETY